MYTDKDLLNMLNYPNKKVKDAFFNGMDCSACPLYAGTCHGSGAFCEEDIRKHLCEKDMLSAEAGEPTAEPTPTEDKPAAANTLNCWENTDTLDVYIKKAKEHAQSRYNTLLSSIENSIKVDIFNQTQQGHFVIRTCVQGYDKMCAIEKIFEKYNIKYKKFEDGTVPCWGGWYHYEFDLTEQE